MKEQFEKDTSDIVLGIAFTLIAEIATDFSSVNTEFSTMIGLARLWANRIIFPVLINVTLEEENPLILNMKSASLTKFKVETTDLVLVKIESLIVKLLSSKEVGTVLLLSNDPKVSTETPQLEITAFPKVELRSPDASRELTLNIVESSSSV